MSNGLRAIASASLLLLVAACSASNPEGTTDADTLTRRQKDSIISTLPIPGAGVVGKALDVSDSAAARAARLDSLLR